MRGENVSLCCQIRILKQVANILSKEIKMFHEVENNDSKKRGVTRPKSSMELTSGRRIEHMIMSVLRCEARKT